MPEEQQDRQPEDELEPDEEVMEDLDAAPEQGEDVRGGQASSDPFIAGRCGP